MSKDEIRKEYLKKRSLLSEEQVDETSIILTQRFFREIDLRLLKTVHTFLPIVDRNELNTWFLIRSLWQDFPEVEVVVPVTDFKNKSMRHARIKPDTVLVTNKYGIPEPERPEFLENIEEISLVVTPLLVVDRALQRIGYGGGFYDRFFEACPSIFKVGMGFFEPIEEVPEIHEHDIPLDKYLYS